MRPKIGAAIVEQFGDGKWHLQAIIAKALAKRPEDRFQAPIEVVAALATGGPISRWQARRHASPIRKDPESPGEALLLPKMCTERART